MPKSLFYAIAISALFIFYVFLFLSKDLYRNSFYILSLIGLIVLFRPGSCQYLDSKIANKKSFFVLAIMLTIISILVYFVYFFSRNYFSSGAWLFLLLIPVSWCMLISDIESKLFYVGFIAVFVIALLSSLFSGMGEISYGDMQSKYSKLLLVLVLLPMFKYFSFTSKIVFPIFGVATLIAGLVAVLDVWFFEFTQIWIFDSFEYESMASGNTNPIHYATFVACTSAVCAVAFLKHENILLKFVYAIAVVVGLSAIILSQSRGVWLSIPFVALCLIIFVSNGQFKRILLLSLPALLVMALASQHPIVKKDMMDAVIQAKEYLQDNKNASHVAHTSVSARIELWKASWEIFTISPVFGVGPGNYKAYKNGLIKDNKYPEFIENYSDAHNQYLIALSGRGLFGLLTTLMVLVIPGLLYFRRIRTMSNANGSYPALAGLVVVIVFSISGLTNSTFQHKYLMMFYIITVSLFYSISSSKAE